MGIVVLIARGVCEEEGARPGALDQRSGLRRRKLRSRRKNIR
jgi:hypothetical protein